MEINFGLKSIKNIGLCSDSSFLILGVFYLVVGLPISFIGCINLLVNLLAGGNSFSYFIGISVFIGLGVYFMINAVLCIASYLKSERLKKSSIYLDGMIVNYKRDNKVKKGDKVVIRLICRCYLPNGQYKDFVSEPIVKDPNYYIGKTVRVCSNSPDFSCYLVDLNTVN